MNSFLSKEKKKKSYWKKVHLNTDMELRNIPIFLVRKLFVCGNSIYKNCKNEDKLIVGALTIKTFDSNMKERLDREIYRSYHLKIILMQR